MSKLDELFERKLTDHSIAPSPGAWENLEARLSKKNNTKVLVRWAAVFLFGSLLFSLLWLRNVETDLPLANETPTIQPSPEVKTKQEVVPLIADIKKDSKPVKVQKKKEIRHPLTQPSLIVVQTPVLLEEKGPLVLESAEQKLNSSGEEVKSASTSKTIVLTFTLDPIELPQTQTAEIKTAATAGRKDKSFKKMMKIANDVKNSDSPLNGIRNMKEDLFALDLKNKTTTKKH